VKRIAVVVKYSLRPTWTVIGRRISIIIFATSCVVCELEFVLIYRLKNSIESTIYRSPLRMLARH